MTRCNRCRSINFLVICFTCFTVNALTLRTRVVVSIDQMKAGGGYSNGDLYTSTTKSLAEIGQLVSQLYQSAPKCPFDVAPDLGTIP